MKISVITLQNVRNYGSVLQTYATQSILEGMGYEVEFIDYVRKNQTKEHIKKEMMQNIPKKQLIRYLYQKYIGDVIRNKKAKKVFMGFIEKEVHVTPKRYYSVKELCDDAPQADIYCTGSDQMWNSGWNGGIEHSYFLDFIDDKPKFSFSTSIGMLELPSNEIKETIELLKKYNFITVREQSGVELLKQYNIESQNVLDPTLMVDGLFWRAFSKKYFDKLNNEEYILVYQLNVTHDNVDFKAYVKMLSKELHMPVKAIVYGVPYKKFFDEYVFMPEMQEFVALFANAKYVVTDSFHGTSFCINLNKQFTVIYPQKYFTRLQNILVLCRLQERALFNIKNELHNQLIDYTEINDTMNEMRSHSLDIIGKGLQEINSHINTESR